MDVGMLISIVELRRLVIESIQDSVEDVVATVETYDLHSVIAIDVSLKHPRLGSVGHVTAQEAGLNEMAWIEEHSNAVSPEALADVKALGAKRAFYVTSSHVDRRFRGEGLGQFAYAHIAIAARSSTQCCCLMRLCTGEAPAFPPNVSGKPWPVTVLWSMVSRSRLPRPQ